MKTFQILVLSFASTVGLNTSAFAETVVPLCERTVAVQDFIVQKINTDQGTKKTCADITQQDLNSLKRVDVSDSSISVFKVGDFSGLPNMEILNIRSNPYTTLPEGLFAGLNSLKTLVIIGTKLRYYPDDFLADTPNLENCYCFRNDVRSISESVLVRLGNLKNLKELEFDSELQDAEKQRLLKLFPEGGPVSLLFN